MPVRTIPFGEWLPDQPDLANPGATLIRNALPAEASYRPWRAPAAMTGPLQSWCRGAIAVKDTAGNTMGFAGDGTRLYRAANAQWADASREGGYALADASGWSMTLWPSIAAGQPQVIAAAHDAPLQAITLGEEAFADLVTGTLRPTGRAMCALTAPPFLMLGSTRDDTYGDKPTRIWWSHIGDPASFDQSQEFECDFQDLPDSIGFVRALVPVGRGAIVLADEALYRATYEGPPTVFGFTEIAGGLGCIAGGSAVKVGGLVYYLSRAGWRVTDGASSTPIGAGKIDRWFLSPPAGQGFLNAGGFDRTQLHRVSGCYDPDSQCILWAVPMKGAAGGLPNMLLAYNVQAGRWTHAEQAVEYLFAAASPGYTLETLDEIADQIDILPASLDDPVWIGGDKKFGAFDTAHRMAFFTGAPLPAVLETGEAAPADGRLATIRSVRPLVDRAEGVAVQVAARNDLTGAPGWSSSRPLDPMGKADLRTTGRYLRARVTVPDGFVQASGIDVDFVHRGDR